MTPVKAVKSAKTIKIQFQKPGSLPEEVKLKSGSTVTDLLNTYNVDAKGYSISIGGSSADGDTSLSNGDVVRVALKTKNARQ
ncbi:MAG: hypothetical protein WC974_09445 [Thermoplasmata archaeon]